MSMRSVRAFVRARARAASCQWPVEAARALHGKKVVTSDGGWASWPQEVTMECGEGKQKEGEEIVFVCVVIGQKQRVTERCIRCSLPPIPPRQSPRFQTF